jgi:hypothetical protein
VTDVAVSAALTDSGWVCSVEVRDAESATRHSVTVSRGDLERLDPGAIGPEALVRRSFAFLLEREPKESILRSFDLPLIGRYFPDFERVIARR